MKIKLGVLLLVLLSLLISTVSAPWQSLSSGYAVWTNYQGVPVPPMTDVTATAGTTEYPGWQAHPDNPKFPNVTAVRFRWMPPSSSDIPEWYNPPLGEPPKPLEWHGDYFDGYRVYTANDTQTVIALGDWGVQAWFYDAEGNLRNQTGVEKIRAASFNVIPDFPVVGTAGAVVVMLLALGVFWHRKKKPLADGKPIFIA